jgi:hypothetical protein
MKRQKVIEAFISLLNPNDVIVFCGEDISKEALTLDNNNFYYTKGPYGLGVVLGIAMCTNKRVFVVCRDADIISDLTTVAQMAAARLKNLFCIILKDDCYQEIDNHATLTDSLYSIKGLLFNYGFVVHDYSHFFKGRINKKLLESTIERIAGPMVIIINTTKGVSNIKEDIPIDLDSRISTFILNDEEGTSLFRGAY